MTGKNAEQMWNIDRMRYPAAGLLGSPLKFHRPPLLTEDQTTLTHSEPEALTPRTRHELLQVGWGGPAAPNPTLPITTTSEPAIPGEVTTASAEKNKEMREAETGENWIEETGEGGESDYEDAESLNSDARSHTCSDNYRQLQVVLEAVMDLKTQVNKLDTSNNNLTKQPGQQSSVIFKLRATVQRLTQELKKKPTEPPPPPPQEVTTPAKNNQQQQAPPAPKGKGKSKSFAEVAAAGPAAGDGPSQK